MTAAVLLGHLALLGDSTSLPRSSGGRSCWHPDATPLAIRAKRDLSLPLPLPLPQPLFCSAVHGKGFHEPDVGGEAAAVAAAAVGAAAGSDSGGGGGDDWNDDEWEKDLRSRLKEMEEMRELERTAEELQSRVAAEGPEESEEEKRERVRRELEKVAKEQAERRKTVKLMFELGQKAYGRGMYGRAIEFLEAALTIIARPTLLGGEIQIWLAMAYEANNRHRDCIALYQELEKKHPSVSIRRQASELRYILQAPKLKISRDEMVTIPLIGSSYDSYAGFWSDKYKGRNKRKTTTTTTQLPSSRDFLSDFLVSRPTAGWEKNRNFWIIVTLWVGLLGTAALLQR